MVNSRYDAKFSYGKWHKMTKRDIYNHQAHLVPELGDYSNLEKFLIGFLF